MMSMTLTAGRQSCNRLARLIEACQDRIKRFISNKVPPYVDAEDIFQEIVMKLIRAESEGGNIEMVSSWLFRSAKNEITDYYRRNKGLVFLEYDDDGDGVDDGTGEVRQISDAMLTSSETPEDAYLRELFWRELEQALSELPDGQREVFVRTELTRTGFRELAEETGVNINTLLARKRRAVRFLQKRLVDLYDLIVYG
jgi:RNA polymerase sigma factor (sigma-70 family)